MKHRAMKALMGQVVVVTHKLERVETAELIHWEAKEIKHRPGWVVGFRYLQIGKIVADFDGTFSEQTRNQVLCILVTYWPTMKPEKVPLDGYRIAKGNEEPCFMHDVWIEENRKAMAEKSKYWQQDGVGGRWVSG